jgi:hypothetical protein
MARKQGGDLTLEVEVDRFNRCLADMQKALGNTHAMQQVVDHEVGRIVNQAIKKTKKATIRSIKRSDEARPPWRTYDLGRGMKKYNLENRYPNAVWGKIQSRMRESLNRKYSARELARRVWVEVLNKLGQKVEATGQAQKAESKNFVAASAAGVKRTNGTGNYAVEIENSFGKNRWVGAAQALFGAIAGRRRFFLQNVAKGVFNDLKTVAAKYPGMEVRY